MRYSTRVSALVALALALPSVANAATREVGTGKQYSTIQLAVNAAVAGDTVLVYAGTYTATVDLLGKAITVKSVSGQAATVIQPTSGSNAITASNVTGAGATIEGFTVRNTNNRGVYASSSVLTLKDVKIENTGAVWLLGGAIQQIGGQLTIENGTFTNNAACAGGDVYVQSGGTLTEINTVHNDSYGNYSGGIESVGATINLTGVTFNAPYADYEGGALRLLGGTGNFTDVDVNDADGSWAHGVAMAIKDGAVVTWNGGTVDGSIGEWCYYGAVWVYNGSTLTGSDLTFSNNLGGIGGALAVVTNSTVTLDNSNFDGNDAMNDGGAAVVWYSSDLNINDVAFTGNETDWDGGAVHLNDSSTLTGTGSSFVNNSSLAYGGAVRANYSGGVTLTGGSFDNNSADNGGGIKANNLSGAVSLTNVAFTGNAAVSGTGGAVDVAGNTDVTATDSSFTGNSSLYEGGAVYSEGGWYVGERSDVTVSNSTFDSNVALSGGGGAIYGGIRAYLVVDGSTLTDNVADDNGGAVWKDLDGDLDLTNSTLSGNHTDADGGGVYVYSTLYGGSTADMTLTGNTFTNNDANDDGGAVAILCSVNVVASDNRMTHNVADDNGGAMYLYYVGNQTLTENFVCGNTAQDGAGAYNTNYWPVTDNWTGNWFQENVAAIYGGGVYHYGAYNLDMVNTSLLANEAASGGGAYLSSSYLTMDGGHVAWNGPGYGVQAGNSISSDNSTFANAHWFQNTPADVGGYLLSNKIAGNGNDAQPPLGVTLDGNCLNDEPFDGPCPGADPVDSDSDGMPDACDVCPAGSDVTDTDGDSIPDGCDACPVGDDLVDGDSDGVADACDVCPVDHLNDLDLDGACDSDDDCPSNGDLVVAGVCGCADEVDTDGDSVPDCNDLCVDGDDLADWDTDGTPDSCDVCQGGVDIIDTDGDAVPDFCDDAGGSPCYDEDISEPIPCLPTGDLDGDGLSDPAEINVYLTDSFDEDTDNDTLLDGEEVMVYGTDPKDADTDGDAWLDAEELVNGTDPLVAEEARILDVNLPTPGTAGLVNNFSLTGGTPGEMVTFYMSRVHGTATVASCPGVTLDMASPSIIGTALVGADGVATYNRFVGVGAAGKKYRIQALELDSCRVSDFEEETF